MEKSKSFTELIVWQKAHEFVLKIYLLTSSFPKSEIFGLTSQFRRAVVSIAANIAEGYVKKGKLDKVRFFNIAQGSLAECKYYTLLSIDLEYISKESSVELDEKIDEISKLLVSYMAKVSRSI